MLTIGYKASAEQFDPRTLLDFGVRAERAGFESVWVSDHLQPWKHTDGHAPFSLAWLGALGQATSRVRIGTSVLTPSFRYHPAVVAQAFGTLGCLFPGRVLLGVGSGESMNESPVGVRWPDTKERFARLSESIKLIQRLWREERVTWEGAYFTTKDATIYDRPEGGVPIYVAAAGESAARLAGRYADGFICTSGKGADLYVDTLLPAVEDGAKRAGRDPSQIDRMIEMKVSFDTDRTRAMEDTREWAALALPAEDKVGVEDPREMERRAAALSAEKAASRWIVSTDPDEHVERIGQYVGWGFRHLVLHMPGRDQAAAIDRYGREILPRLRKRYP